MPVKQLKLNFKPLLKKLEIFTKKQVIGQLTGRYTTAIRGRGLEFDGYREYTITDDARTIDWKASLRSDQTLVKKYVEERDVEITILFDTSNSMLFSSTGKLKAEYSAELIATLAFAILQAGDSLGIVMFSSKIKYRILPKSGLNQFHAIIKELENVNNYGGQFNLKDALEFVKNYINNRGILIIISDFIGMPEDWDLHLGSLKEQFDIMPVMIRDPRDMEFPKKGGEVLIEDPFTNKQIVVNTEKYADYYLKNVMENIKKVKTSFRKMNARMLLVRTDKPFVDPINQFFKAPR